ncbi:MAG: phage holin family protein [Oscillospiraceae bacterium]|jgi:uncharacterized membrane protein|nr:phage holin family protein [Oscillospiraceae bacterium]
MINWKQKLTSRKFWVALAGLVVGVIALLGIQTDTAQITGVIMALGSVVAYIVGEGLVDAASAGTTVNINGNAALTPTGEVVSTDVSATASTGADRAAQIKHVTATGSGESGAVAPDTTDAE